MPQALVLVEQGELGQRELEDDLQRRPRADRPVLLALGQLPTARQQGDLPPLPGSSTALLLDASALGALQPADDSPGIPRLVSRSVLEGGRGTLDKAATEEFLNTVVQGAEAARAGERVPTRDAVDALTAQMTTDVADRMSTFLAALWQDGGSTLASFPAPQRGVGYGPDVPAGIRGHHRLRILEPGRPHDQPPYPAAHPGRRHRQPSAPHA
ncbi:hypothetical protein [Streptomyces sp. NPDC005805]|uniref:hypothetical protein n=1 Tax=Streptomyces sp. NPDC005805 TaxID=3157068 RepID=UPI0033DB18FE